MIVYRLFHDFVHVYSSGARAENLGGQTFYLKLIYSFCYFDHFCEVSSLYSK